MLAVRDLSFSYGAGRGRQSRKALDRVGFSVGEGEFAALLGPNGAGKSTLFGLLTRLFTSREGRIAVAGHDLARHPRQALAAMGVVFQQPTLDLDLTVLQNLRYFAALHGLSGRAAERRIAAALDLLDITDRAGETARALNGGHRRRAEIARAMVHEPKVLLLDEPTVGLDAAARAAITAHVHELCSYRRLTVLWATHLTDEVRAEDRLLVLHAGRIVADGIARDLQGAAALPDYFIGLTGTAA